MQGSQKGSQIRVAALVNWGLGLELVKGLHALPEVLLSAVLGHCQDMSTDPWRNAVRDYCLSEGILFYPAQDMTMQEIEEVLQREQIDLAVTHAWPVKLSESVYTCPRLGMVNFHASLLPRHRGRSPHLAALKSGDKSTGLTCHVVDGGLDTGPIVAQAACSLVPGETPESLVEKIKTLAVPLLAKSVRRMLHPEFSPKPQPCNPRR